MSISKSEGVWGNTETYPHSRERYRGQQQQPEREPRTGGKTVKSRQISELLPSQSPPQKTNYLFLFINSLVSYGHENRSAINHSVWQPLREAYPPPPGTHAATVVSHKNIFRKKGMSNASIN